MTKRDLAERIIRVLDDKELINLAEYNDNADAYKDVFLVLEKVFADYIIIQGQIVE